MMVQMIIEQTGADDHEGRDEIFGWICQHVAGERLVVKLSEDERFLIVEFPDQQKMM